MEAEHFCFGGIPNFFPVDVDCVCFSVMQLQKFPLFFGHQVGVIDGLMTTFLDVDSVVVEQVVPMTRFTIRLSVGDW